MYIDTFDVHDYNYYFETFLPKDIIAETLELQTGQSDIHIPRSSQYGFDDADKEKENLTFAKTNNLYQKNLFSTNPCNNILLMKVRKFFSFADLLKDIAVVYPPLRPEDTVFSSRTVKTFSFTGLFEGRHAICPPSRLEDTTFFNNQCNARIAESICILGCG